MICACEIRTFLSVKQKVLKKCQRFVLVPQPKSCFGPNRLNWSLSAWQIICPGHGYLPCPWMVLYYLACYDMICKSSMSYRLLYQWLRVLFKTCIVSRLLEAAPPGRLFFLFFPFFFFFYIHKPYPTQSTEGQ